MGKFLKFVGGCTLILFLLNVLYIGFASVTAPQGSPEAELAAVELP